MGRERGLRGFTASLGLEGGSEIMRGPLDLRVGGGEATEAGVLQRVVAFCRRRTLAKAHSILTGLVRTSLV